MPIEGYQPGEREPANLEELLDWLREEFWRISSYAEYLKELAEMGSDFFFDVSEGVYPDKSPVNKFGHSHDVDSGVATDLWDRSATQKIWLAPTAARSHSLVSTSALDVAGGAGAREFTVWGLKTWDSEETSEVVIPQGLTPVNLAEDYVIIHRIEATDFGASGPNVGTITITAAAPDSTVTAQVNPLAGQTQMAIYGVPSTKKLKISTYYAAAIKGGPSVSVSRKLLVATRPETQPGVFVEKHIDGISTDGTNAYAHPFVIPKSIPGPAIVKVQGDASTNNTPVSGGFDAVLVNQ